MSEALHPTRLEWDGRKGFARHDGVQIELRHSPGRQYHQVHYTPGLQADVQEHPSDPRREMTGAEVAMFSRWLINAARRMREAIDQLG